MTATLLSTTLTADHLTYLAGEGISEDVATAHQAYSVQARMELPTELQWAWDGVGIVFTHFLLDGTTVPQYRPDAPTHKGDDGKALKYVFPARIQNGPFVSPLQTGLIAAGTATEAAGVEGTKGFLAVISLLHAAGALQDMLVLGLPGCWGGVQDGLYSADYADIVPAGAAFTAFLDGDVAKKTGVYDAAERLLNHLGVIGLEPKLAVLPVGGANGISDYLGNSLKTMSAARKLDTVRNLAKRARKTMPRRPAEKKANKSAGGAKVMWDHEVIATFYLDEQGVEHIGDVLLDAAVRPVAIRVEIDDLNPRAVPSSSFDLQIRKGSAIYSLNRVSSNSLNTPRTWLSTLPGAFGETITMKPRMGEDIGEAIRAGSGHAGAEVPVFTTIKRSGWYTRQEGEDMVTRYVTGNFAIGPEDSTDDLTGNIADGRSDGLIYAEDPHSLTEEECAAAILEVLRVGDDLMIDGTGWVMGIGMHCRATGGGTRTGGIIFTGTPGCGKTSLLRGLSSLQAPGVDLDTFEGTVNAVGGMGRGLHHAVKYVDDFRDKSAGGFRAAQQQHAALSALSRRMIGGSEGVKARERVDKASGDIVAGVKESAEPVIMVTAELAAIPTGKGTESDMERLMVVSMDRPTSFRRGGVNELKELSANGTLHRANAAFIRNVAVMINVTFGSMEAFQQYKDGLHEHYMEELAEMEPEVQAPRRYEVAANVLVGYHQFLSAACYYNAIEPDEVDRRMKEAKAMVARVMLNHHRVFLGGAEGTDSTVVDQLVSAVVSGRYNIDDPTVTLTGGSTRLGWPLTLKDGTQGIAILPAVAMAITGLPRQSLNVAMMPYIIPGSDSAYTRKVRNGTKGTLDAYFLTLGAWGSDAELEYDEAA
ncbi:hypothetical protein [Arthrobacter sp. 2MCAF14]|uniref:hypothetical protein n=1 Tax=Arthrobacter sp. 2MCAF14 TaxID=3232982 RepID=UPI003F906558